MAVCVVKLSTYKLPGCFDPLVLPFRFFEICELVARMKDWWKEGIRNVRYAKKGHVLIAIR